MPTNMITEYPAEAIFNKYKATHTDKQIAQIVNHRSNIIVTNTEINRFKGKYKFEDKLKNVARAKELGINLSFAKKTLKMADLNMSLQADKLAGGFFNSISAFFKSIFILLFRFWKFILIAILAIFLILLFFKLNDRYSNSQSNEKIETETELKEVQEIPINKHVTEEIISKNALSFAKPLDDLTKSVTDISEFNSIVENQNVIPVIGSMFEFNSTVISGKGKAVLAGFANEYKKLELPNTVLIEGFTCTLGSKGYNEKLAEKRADNLKEELIRLGIPENDIVIKPIGMQNFVTTDNRNKDLVLNRRSNVTIMNAE